MATLRGFVFCSRRSGEQQTRRDLRGADLRQANLIQANLNLAHLWGAELSEANLSRADLAGTLIQENVLFGTNFEGAEVRFTVLADVDLSRCIGLDSVYHRAPSILGIDSIIRSKGRII